LSGVKLSACIMTDSRRADLLATLVGVLGADAAGAPLSISCDTCREGVWPNAQRAWRSVARGATHHLVLQDDVMPCAHFFDGVRAALSAVPEVPVSFFCTRKVVLEAKAAGLSWVVIPDGAWGPAMCLPVGMIEPWLEWCERYVRPEFKHDDSRLAMYLLELRTPAWCTVPSLVEHIGAEHSLLGQGGARRVAKWFGGYTFDARAVDWSRGVEHPLRAPNGISRDYYKYLERGGVHGSPR
jgi:hypothetical protein